MLPFSQTGDTASSSKPGGLPKPVLSHCLRRAMYVCPPRWQSAAWPRPPRGPGPR